MDVNRISQKFFSKISRGHSKKNSSEIGLSDPLDTPQSIPSSSTPKKHFLWRKLSYDQTYHILPPDKITPDISPLNCDCSPSLSLDYPISPVSPTISPVSPTLIFSPVSPTIVDVNAMSFRDQLSYQLSPQPITQNKNVCRTRMDTNVPKVYPTRLFSVANTFNIPPAKVRLQIILALFHLSLTFTESNVLTISVPAPFPEGDELIFTIQLVAIKWTQLIGVQFTKVQGESMQYAKVCRNVLDQLKI
jgi:hypothetical protein